jgi:hypothetical protein
MTLVLWLSLRWRGLLFSESPICSAATPNAIMTVKAKLRPFSTLRRPTGTKMTIASPISPTMISQNPAELRKSAPMVIYDREKGLLVVVLFIVDCYDDRIGQCAWALTEYALRHARSFDPAGSCALADK